MDRWNEGAGLPRVYAKNSQDLWQECRARAAAIGKKHGFWEPKNDREYELLDEVSDAIFRHGQELLEAVYRSCNAEAKTVVEEALRSPEVREEMYGRRDACEDLQGFLRPLIADEIDATIEYEEMEAREAGELRGGT